MSRFLGLFAFAFSAATITAAEPVKQSKPNIVYILADDLGAGDLGCYNRDSKIPTPNMDRLAADGMRFTDAHSPSGVCTPTRYGILTGRYAWRTRMKQGVLQGYDPLLIEPGRLTVAALLKQNGYRTHCVGKWHLGLGDVKPTDYAKSLKPGPLTVGFDTFFGIPASLDMPPYVFVDGEKLTEQPTAKIGDSKEHRDGGAGFWRAGPIGPTFKHADVLPRCTERAVALIADHAKNYQDKPFFLYLPFSAPHTPWLPTKEFEDKSKAGYYGDFTVQVDDSVGQVLAALKKHGMAENTLVIVTSDNGAHWLASDIEKYGHLANNGRRGQKSDIHEGGHRLPFLVRWPGKVKPGTTSDVLICHVDLMATVADVLGAKLPADAAEDSESILPALRGKAEGRGIHEAVVHHSGNGLFAIRQGDWKLVDGLGSGGFTAPANVKPQPGGPTGQLYNLAKDPAEKVNRFQDEPETVKRLAALLKKYRDEGHSARRLAGK